MESSLRIALITPFIDALQETFATLASMDLRRKAVYVKEGADMFGEVSGIIGLSGGTMGTCVISLSTTMAEELIRSMLIMAPDQPVSGSAICDGVGELVTMVAAGAKKRLSSTQYQFDLSLPTVISGENLELFHRDSVKSMVILMESPSGQGLTLEVCAECR